MSKKDVPRILRPPSRGRAGNLISRDSALMARSYWRPYPLAVKRVEGAVVEDLDSNLYIDFTAGHGLLPLGGNPPKVLEAVRRQVSQLLSYPLKAAYSEQALDLVEQLSKIAPIRGSSRAILLTSGSEAVEAALRALRLHTLKPLVLGFLGGFHGTTQGALAVSSDSAGRRRGLSAANTVHAPYPYCYRCPLGLDPSRCGLRCVNYLEEHLLEHVASPEELALALFESIEVESGVVTPPQGYYERLLPMLRRRGVHVVADETSIPLGAAGRWLAIKHWDAEVDGLCLGSSLASGLPLGVFLAREELLDLEPGQWESGSEGLQISMAAALATLETIREEGLIERAERLGRRLVRRLRDLADELGTVGEVRGRGLLLGIELVEDEESKRPASKLAQTVVEECFRVGLITRRSRQTIILTPPLNMEEELLEKGLEILEAKLREISTE